MGILRQGFSLATIIGLAYGTYYGINAYINNKDGIPNIIPVINFQNCYNNIFEDKYSQSSDENTYKYTVNLDNCGTKARLNLNYSVYLLDKILPNHNHHPIFNKTFSLPSDTNESYTITNSFADGNISVEYSFVFSYVSKNDYDLSFSRRLRLITPNFNISTNEFEIL